MTVQWYVHTATGCLGISVQRFALESSLWPSVVLHCDGEQIVVSSSYAGVHSMHNLNLVDPRLVPETTTIAVAINPFGLREVRTSAWPCTHLPLRTS